MNICICNKTLQKGKQWIDEHKRYRIGIIFGRGRTGMDYQIQVIIQVLYYDLSEGSLECYYIFKRAN